MKKLTTLLFAIAMAAMANAQQTSGQVIFEKTFKDPRGVFNRKSLATGEDTVIRRANVGSTTSSLGLSTLAASRNRIDAGSWETNPDAVAWLHVGGANNDATTLRDTVKEGLTQASVVQGWASVRGGTTGNFWQINTKTQLSPTEFVYAMAHQNLDFTNVNALDLTHGTLSTVSGTAIQNAYAFTPEMDFEIGRIYKVTYYVRLQGAATSVTNHIPVQLSIVLANGQTADSVFQNAHTRQIMNINTQQADLVNWDLVTAEFVAARNGSFNLGFRHHTASTSAQTWRIDVDSIKVTVGEMATQGLVSTLPTDNGNAVWGYPIRATFSAPISTDPNLLSGVTISPDPGGVRATVVAGMILDIACNPLTPGTTYTVTVPKEVIDPNEIFGTAENLTWTFTAPSNFYSLEHFPATINNNTVNMPTGWNRSSATRGGWTLVETHSPREGSGGFIESTPYFGGTAGQPLPERANMGLFSPRMLELEVGKEYKVTFWTRTMGEWTYDLDLVLCRGNSIENIVQVAGSVQIENATDWTKREITFVAKVTGITNIGFRHRSLRSTSLGTPARFLHVDGFIFEEGDGQRMTFNSTPIIPFSPAHESTAQNVDSRVVARFNMIEPGDFSQVRILNLNTTVATTARQRWTEGVDGVTAVGGISVSTRVSDDGDAELVIAHNRFVVDMYYRVVIPPSTIQGLSGSTQTETNASATNTGRNDTVSWIFRTETLDQVINARDTAISQMQRTIYTLTTDLTDCQGSLTICQNSLTTCRDSLETSDADLLTCQDDFRLCGNDREDLEIEIERLLKLLENCGDPNSVLRQLPQSKINVFPNPTSSELHIVDFDFKQGDLVQLYDMNGKVVFQERANTTIGNFTINISGLPNGAYILRIGHQVTQIIKN